MIVSEHSVLRGAGLDDARIFKKLYDSGMPSAALLDQRREFQIPTFEEVEELLGGRREVRALGGLTAVEDLEGRVLGFCALRASPGEAFMGQIGLLFLDPKELPASIGGEVMDFLLTEAFQRKRYRKVLSYCLDHETALRDLLVRHGFESDGVQREVLFAKGRWFNLESFTLFNATTYTEGRSAAS